MVLFLGVARAMKAMHQYRVKGPPGGAKAQRKASAVREQAAAADADASRRHRRRNGDAEEDDADIEQEPLMEGEVAMSQEGLGEGQLRAYAHRDIKPGKMFSTAPQGNSLPGPHDYH